MEQIAYKTMTHIKNTLWMWNFVAVYTLRALYFLSFFEHHFLSNAEKGKRCYLLLFDLFGNGFY